MQIQKQKKPIVGLGNGRRAAPRQKETREITPSARCAEGRAAGSYLHLFSIFDGSRVHQQSEKSVSRDDAPPDLYFTIINTQLLESQHKNRFGVFRREDAAIDLFIEDMHIDHDYLSEHRAPPTLGTLALALCAITARVIISTQGYDHQHTHYNADAASACLAPYTELYRDCLEFAPAQPPKNLSH